MGSSGCGSDCLPAPPLAHCGGGTLNCAAVLCRAMLCCACCGLVSLQVFDPSPGSEERVVALTSTEDALSPYCAAQDGLIRCVIALTAGRALHTVVLASCCASRAERHCSLCRWPARTAASADGFRFAPQHLLF